MYEDFIKQNKQLNLNEDSQTDELNEEFEGYLGACYAHIVQESDKSEDEFDIVLEAFECCLDDTLVESILAEVSPSSAAAKRFVKKGAVKQDFKRRYGKNWKRAFYAVAWKIQDKNKGKSTKAEEYSKWNLEGTDELVKNYKKNTPGQ